ncbi:MAG: hypothetical protein ABW192_02235, partial [Sphingobium sp.]
SLVGANLLRGMREEPAVADATRALVWDLLRQGRLTLPRVARRYPLDCASEALAAVANGEDAGRILISVNPALETGV